LSSSSCPWPPHSPPAINVRPARFLTFLASPFRLFGLPNRRRRAPLHRRLFNIYLVVLTTFVRLHDQPLSAPGYIDHEVGDRKKLTPARLRFLPRHVSGPSS